MKKKSLTFNENQCKHFTNLFQALIRFEAYDFHENMHENRKQNAPKLTSRMQKMHL